MNNNSGFSTKTFSAKMYVPEQAVPPLPVKLVLHQILGYSLNSKCYT